MTVGYASVTNKSAWTAQIPAAALQCCYIHTYGWTYGTARH